MDEAHQLLVERIGAEVRARIVIGPLSDVVARASAPETAELEIRATDFEAERGARRGPDLLRAGLATAEGFVELATLDGRYLSTEVAGGFTGRVIGVEALGEQVIVSRFEYAPGAAAE